MPFPRLASNASGASCLVLGFLQRKARPPLPGLPTALFALASPSQRAQQFPKNAYHDDKCVISEPNVKAVHRPLHTEPVHKEKERITLLRFLPRGHQNHSPALFLT
jgi:hypothetical protein